MTLGALSNDKTEQAPAATSIAAGFDVVYFLMSGGWTNELRSNRWHYARRWARHVPVVLVQPEQPTPFRGIDSHADPRIPNCRVLRVREPRGLERVFDDGLTQAGQVAADMREHGFRRPLLWMYNPLLVALYAALPAVGRVYHATENYFDDDVPEFFIDELRATIATSDLTIAVSDGVAAGLRAQAPGAEVAVVTNGCDYEQYARFEADSSLRAAGAAYERIAIYAGNINNRLDFDLLHDVSERHASVLFAFYGPLGPLGDDDRSKWASLLGRSNVRYFGPADADELQNLYGAADVGIIPYKTTRLLVENGFPLKALEMCATGLPVVATLMRPIEGLADALVVARDAGEFDKALTVRRRGSLPDAERRELERVCRANDYDLKFEETAALLAGLASRSEPDTRMGLLFPHIPTELWLDYCVAHWEANAPFSTTAARGLLRMGRLYSRIAGLTPRSIRRAFPQRVRTALSKAFRG